MRILQKPRAVRCERPVVRGCFFTAIVLLTVSLARADVTGVRITKDEIAAGGNHVRHITGVISGAALRNESVPTLEKCAGLKYESDFELWVPVDGFNGRFWFN